MRVFQKSLVWTLANPKKKAQNPTRKQCRSHIPHQFSRCTGEKLIFLPRIASHQCQISSTTFCKPGKQKSRSNERVCPRTPPTNLSDTIQPSPGKAGFSNQNGVLPGVRELFGEGGGNEMKHRKAFPKEWGGLAATARKVLWIRQYFKSIEMLSKHIITA